MGDPASKYRLTREIVVQVQRIRISGDLGEPDDVIVSDALFEAGRHSFGKILEEVTPGLNHARQLPAELSHPPA